MMSVAGIAKDILEDLRHLLKFPYAILLLAVLVGSNIALARGFGIALPHASLEVLQKQVSAGETLLFLCLMIFYLTTVSNAMQWLFVQCFLGSIRNLRDWWRKFNGTPVDVRPRDGAVFKFDILKKANGEASSYYLSIYKQHERAESEADAEDRQLSSHALGTIVLLLIDLAWERDQSLPAYAYMTLRDKLTGFIACSFLGLVSVALIGALLAPILSDSSPWIYCPGFPKNAENEEKGTGCA